MRNTTDYKIEVVLIRHGKTKGNEEKRYIGRTDEGLSEKGKMELMGKTYPEVDKVFASPMKRCLETAKLIYDKMDVYCNEKLHEIDFGEFEGKNYQELSTDLRYQAWIDSGGTIAFPGGESREKLISRSVEGFSEIISGVFLEKQAESESEGRVENYSENKENRRIALVVHGGTIMAILSKLFGGDYFDYQVKNGEGYSVIIEGNERFWKITKIDKIRLEELKEK